MNDKIEPTFSTYELIILRFILEKYIDDNSWILGLISLQNKLDRLIAGYD